MDISSFKFSKEHIWVLPEMGGYVKIGISDYAQKKLKAIVFVNLPNLGKELALGMPFGDIESIKTVEELISPITGEVVEVHEDLLDEPERIHAAPYESWLVKARCVEYAQGMMDASAYAEYVGKL